MNPTQKLLIVEDNPGDARLIIEMLRDSGSNIVAESLDTLAAAVDRLAVADVDAALLDLGLPDSQGLETFARLRDAASGVAIIVLTGNSDTGLGIRAVQEGAQDFLVKGRVDGELLKRAIAYAIERKHVEKALRRSEEKYSVAFHASPDAITITRLCDGKLVEVNEGYEQLLGYTRAESIGKTLDELSAYADPGARDDLVTRLREAAEVKDFDATLRRKDGTSVAVIVSAQVLDFQGEECFLAIAHDITERRRAEEERRRADRFFRDTFEHADVGIAHVNSTDGTWLRVNQRLCDLLGYTREELLQTTFAAITHPDDVEQNVRHLHKMLAGDEDTYAAEKRYLRKDGSIVWVHLNVALIRNEDGTPDYNITVLTDITERKRVEEALASSERFSQRVLETSPNLIYIYDLVENRNVYTNREITDFLGYTPEEILAFGSALFERILHPDDAALVAEHHARVQKLAPGDDSVLEVDYRMKRADDEWRWLHSRDIPFARDESGTVTQILGSTDDITEQRAATELLRESEAKLRTLFELLPVGVSVLDAESRVTYANPALERIIGISEEGLRKGEYDTRTYLDANGDLLSPDGFASARAAREGRVVEVETGIVKKDGQVVWTNVSARPVAISDWRVIVVTVDITADKEAEELAARQAERVEKALTSVIDIAGHIGEMRDPYTAGHQRRVAELATRIAQDLDMPDREVADIRVAGLLHDMGKVGVPTEILGKPGAISPTEFELIKGHAEAGYQLAVSANMEEPTPELIYEHHERCDGSGYPRGLLGDQILPGAKVLAVADVVEAMVSYRPYRPALGIEAALAEIERGAGSLYDAEVSKACVSLFRDGGFEFSS